MSSFETGLIVVGANALVAVAAFVIDFKHAVDRKRRTGESILTGDTSGLSWFLTGMAAALFTTFIVVTNVHSLS